MHTDVYAVYQKRITSLILALEGCTVSTHYYNDKFQVTTPYLLKLETDEMSLGGAICL